MRKMLSMSLAVMLVCAHVSALGAQAPATGVIAGTAMSAAGVRLSNITMQVVNPTGAVVGTDVTERDGAFSIPGVTYGTYTVQCVQKDKVIGTASVTLSAATTSLTVRCASESPVPFYKKKSILAALGAAAVAVGTAAVVTADPDASGAR